MTKVTIGSIVQIKRGIIGEGYRFTISSIVKQADNTYQVYGNNDSYGPVRVSDLIVPKR